MEFFIHLLLFGICGWTLHIIEHESALRSNDSDKNLSLCTIIYINSNKYIISLLIYYFSSFLLGKKLNLSYVF